MNQNNKTKLSYFFVCLVLISFIPHNTRSQTCSGSSMTYLNCYTCNSNMCTQCIDGYGTYGACVGCGKGEYSSGYMSTCTACPAGKYSGINSGSCSTCPAGTYSATGASVCLSCQPGQYSAAGASVCSPCPGGTYSTTSGGTSISSCLSCPSGQFSGPDSSSCTSCAAGTTINAASTGCIKCAAGQYSSVGASVCSNCGPGTSSAEGASSCTPCSPGTYSTGGGSSCSPCAGGQYQSASGATSCNTCPAGQYSNPGSSSCSDCGVGTYSVIGSGACSPCPGGTYSNVIKATSCTYCGQGQYSNPGSTSCSPCLAGTYSGGGVAVCPNCPAGTYSGAGATSCIPCSPGYYSNAGATSCSPCAAGTFSGTGQGTCTPCPAGQYSASGAVTCNTCPGGTYSLANSASCTTCNAGQYSGSKSASCTACPVGQYSSAGEASCSLCAPGTYSTGNAPSCTICPAGKYSPEGASSCSTCLAGQYSLAGSSACSTCPAGTYSLANAGSCTDCPAGRYSGMGSGSCSICAAGQYSSVASPSCSTCPAGSYSLQESASCTLCPIGTYSSSPGAPALASCVPCSPGQYSGLGASICDLCPGGQYQSLSGQSSCNICSAGYYSDPGSASCTLCSPGQYAILGSASCSICPGGQYSLAGAASCVICPGGQYSNPQSSSCATCLAGQWSSAGSPSCSLCAAGTYSSAGDAICTICIAGSYSNPGAPACTPCKAGTYSQSPGASAASYCQNCPAGYYSKQGAIVCLICPAGQYSPPGSASCKPCPIGMSSYAGASSCFATPSSSVSDMASYTMAAATQVGSSVNVGSSLFANFGLIAKIIQNIRYMEITVSEDLENAFKTWDTNVFSWDIPNALSSLSESRTLPYNFDQYDVDSRFLVNYWSNLMNILIGTLCFFIFRFLKSTYKVQLQSRLVVSSVLDYAVLAASNFVVVQIYGSLDDIVFYAVLDLQSTKFSPAFSAFNSLLAIVLFIAGFGILACHLWMMHKYFKLKKIDAANNLNKKKNDDDDDVPEEETASEKFLKKFKYLQVLHRDFRETSFIRYSYLAIMVLRVMLSNLIIVTLFKQPLAQAVLLMLFNTIMVVLLVTQKPFNELYDHMAQKFFEVVVWIAYLCVLIMAISDHMHKNPVTMRASLSRCIIILNTILFLGCLALACIAIYKQIVEIYEAWLVYKGKKKAVSITKLNDVVNIKRTERERSQATEQDDLTTIQNFTLRKSGLETSYTRPLRIAGGAGGGTTEFSLENSQLDISIPELERTKSLQEKSPRGRFRNHGLAPRKINSLEADSIIIQDLGESRGVITLEDQEILGRVAPDLPILTPPKEKLRNKNESQASSTQSELNFSHKRHVKRSKSPGKQHKRKMSSKEVFSQQSRESLASLDSSETLSSPEKKGFIKPHKSSFHEHSTPESIAQDKRKNKSKIIAEYILQQQQQQQSSKDGEPFLITFDPNEKLSTPTKAPIEPKKNDQMSLNSKLQEQIKKKSNLISKDLPTLKEEDSEANGTGFGTGFSFGQQETGVPRRTYPIQRPKSPSNGDGDSEPKQEEPQIEKSKGISKGLEPSNGTNSIEPKKNAIISSNRQAQTRVKSDPVQLKEEDFKPNENLLTPMKLNTNEVVSPDSKQQEQKRNKSKVISEYIQQQQQQQQQSKEKSPEPYPIWFEPISKTNPTEAQEEISPDPRQEEQIRIKSDAVLKGLVQSEEVDFKPNENLLAPKKSSLEEEMTKDSEQQEQILEKSNASSRDPLQPKERDSEPDDTGFSLDHEETALPQYPVQRPQSPLNEDFNPEINHQEFEENKSREVSQSPSQSKEEEPDLYFPFFDLPEGPSSPDNKIDLNKDTISEGKQTEVKRKKSKDISKESEPAIIISPPIEKLSTPKESLLEPNKNEEINSSPKQQQQEQKRTKSKIISEYILQRQQEKSPEKDMISESKLKEPKRTKSTVISEYILQQKQAKETSPDKEGKIHAEKSSSIEPKKRGLNKESSPDSKQRERSPNTLKVPSQTKPSRKSSKSIPKSSLQDDLALEDAGKVFSRKLLDERRNKK